MMPLTLRNIGIAGTLAALTVLAVLLGWGRNDEIRDHAPALPAEPAWKLPKAAGGDLTAYATILAQHQPFGQNAAAANAVGRPGTPGNPTNPATAAGGAAAPAIQWRVGGIVTTDDSPYLVLLINKSGEKITQPELRRLGDTLPDGSVVRGIEPGSVTLDREGTPATIKMFVRN